jgi:hypothetical protein
MTKAPPPIPPDNRNPKERDARRQRPSDDARGRPPVPNNLEDQDRQGNIHQNTHHQGYQQDR